MKFTKLTGAEQVRSWSYLPHPAGGYRFPDSLVSPKLDAYLLPN